MLSLAVLFCPLITPFAEAEVFTVPLSRQRVPVDANGRTVSHKAVYYGSMQVGHPHRQNFTVVFDTGSGHLILPCSTCGDESCMKHRRYNPAASSSSVDVEWSGREVAASSAQRDLVPIVYGTGEIVGKAVSEVACLGQHTDHINEGPQRRANCARVRLVCAAKMSVEPFGSFDFDGVLGLGLESLALNYEFNFFSQVTRDGRVAPIFSVFLAASEGLDQSEITFGGRRDVRARGPTRWVPVLSPEKGYWQVALSAVRIGSEGPDLCADGYCVAVLDTGTSLLGVPRSDARAFHMSLARLVPPGSPSDVDCRRIPGPPLVFDLGDFSVELGASDYSRPAVMNVNSGDASENAVPRAVCRSSLLPVDLPQVGPKVFLWGEPVLQRYYTTYDAHRQRVGFAPAAQEGTPVASGSGQRGEDSEKLEIQV